MNLARFKGKFGEWIVALYLSKRLDKTVYHVINDIFIPDHEGGTTQIDHVIFSAFGVFVIETKHMKGWIFGSTNAAKWTQTIYRKKHSFQNPFRQNYKHIKCLAEITGLDERHLFNIVIFIGDCTIKTRDQLPESLVTDCRDLAAFIKKHQTPVIPIETLHAVVQQLSSKEYKNTFANRRAHLSHVRKIAKHKKQKPTALTILKLVLKILVVFLSAPSSMRHNRRRRRRW